MYKITLYDMNCSPIADGVAVFFVENIDEFQQKWEKEMGDIGEKETVERFRRSKAGEMVTDWYSNLPEYNIVQQANTDVRAEKTLVYHDLEFDARNAYGYPSTHYVKEITVHLKWITWDKKYYLIASWEAVGCCREDIAGGGWMEETIYGNRILQNNVINTRELVESPDGYGKIAVYKDKDEFAGNSIRSFCYRMIREFDSENSMIEDCKKFSDGIWAIKMLYDDVVGEAG